MRGMIVVIVEGQLIEISWGTQNKKHFESKGYKYSGIGTKLVVKAEDLMMRGNISIEYRCDNDKCENIFTMAVKSINNMQTKHGSVYCKECSYRRISENKIAKHKEVHDSLNEIEVYKKLLSGEINQFPEGFVVNATINQCKNIVIYLINYLLERNLIKEKTDALTYLTQKRFSKYKISRLVDRFGINNIMNEIFGNQFNQWQYNMVDDGFWQNDENVRNAFYWFMNKLVEDGTIESIDNLPKISYKNKLVEYKVSGILKRFNNSFSQVATFVDPHRFKFWFFNVPLNYYKDENNIKEMMDWFILKIFEDKVVKDIDEIPKLITRNIFDKYKLSSMLSHCFHTSPYYAIDYVYPNRWQRWEYRHVPNDFWNDPNNLRDALIWFVDRLKLDGVITDVNDLNNLNINKLLVEYKLATLCGKYDMPFMLCMIFGADINYKNYSQRISEIDDTKLDSIEEKQLHDIIISNLENVKKPKMGDRLDFINDKEDETYVPDWIINNELIVEYFGLYTVKTANGYQNKYRDKTMRKITYFNNLNNYKFIPLFPNDISNNYEGMVNKFSDYGINLVI